MRLVSKHHDYYDGVVGSTANDKTYTFVRENEEMEIEIDCPAPFERYGNPCEHTVQGGVLGFCGELYPFISVYDYTAGKEDFFYNIEDLEKAFPKIKEHVKKYYYAYSGYESYKTWLEGGIVKRYWDGNFELDKSEIGKLFTQVKTAYFVIKRNSDRKPMKTKILELYPSLQNYGFGKIYDAYSCFQKIEHYLTNELVKPDEINIHIPDDMKAQAHGYDKMSFRKEKQK